VDTLEGRETEGRAVWKAILTSKAGFVPHDVQGMINLMGKDYFLRYLTEFFEKTPTNFHWNAYCNHSDEPVHTLRIFTYAGAPWLSQKWSRFIMDHAYGTRSTDSAANDDVGQMSAWYVLSAIGFYRSRRRTEYISSAARCSIKVTIQLDAQYYQGRTSRSSRGIIHHRISTFNLRSSNGKPLKARLAPAMKKIVAGGTLEFQNGL